MPDGSSQHPLSPIGHNAAPSTDDALAVIRAVLLDPDAADRGKLASSLHAVLLDHACEDEASRADARHKLETAVTRWDAERPDIENEDQNAKAVDCAARLAAHLRIEDNARTAAKRPYLDGGKKIDAVFKARTTSLERGLGDNAKRSGMRGRLIRWQDRLAAIAAEQRRKAEAEARAAAEEARRHEEHLREVAEAAAKGAPVDEATLQATQLEADRLRRQQAEAEARAAHAAAQAAAPTQTRTGHGALATIQTRYRVEITDPAALPRQYLIPDIACIKAALDAGQDIPGARLVPETGVVLR